MCLFVYRCIRGTQLSTEAETGTILLPLRIYIIWPRTEAYEEFMSSSDALEVIEAINGYMDGVLGPQISNILGLASCFDRVSFGHIPRKFMVLLTLLERGSLCDGAGFKSEDFPEWLSKSLS